MLDTTFVKVVCWDSNEWDCSCRVVDLIWHMAKEDAKNLSLSKPKIDLAATKDTRILHPSGLQRTTGQAGP